MTGCGSPMAARFPPAENANAGPSGCIPVVHISPSIIERCLGRPCTEKSSLTAASAPASHASLEGSADAGYLAPAGSTSGTAPRPWVKVSTRTSFGARGYRIVVSVTPSARRYRCRTGLPSSEDARAGVADEMASSDARIITPAIACSHPRRPLAGDALADARHRSLSMQRTYLRGPPTRHPPFDPRRPEASYTARRSTINCTRMHPNRSERFTRRSYAMPARYGMGWKAR